MIYAEDLELALRRRTDENHRNRAALPLPAAPIAFSPSADRPDSNPATSAVVADDLSKTYSGGVEALKGVSFAVKQGEIFGMLGPNGAGKSTTIGILTTMARPTAGRAFVAGHDVVKEPLAVRRNVGLVFQEQVLDNEFSGRQNLRLHAELWRMSRQDSGKRIAELLDVMGLGERQHDGVTTYSGGMRRRLELARALLARPRILFLDEPTLGLDPSTRRQLWELIQSLRQREGVTTFLSTHYLEEAERLCDRVAIVDRGLIVALDTPAALRSALGEEVIELKIDGDVQSVLRAVADLEPHGPAPLALGATVTVPVTAATGDPNRLVEALRSISLPIAGISLRRSTLDDVFHHLTGARIAGEAMS
jgi:ABC-2 type transport system ATP-binding protein